MPPTVYWHRDLPPLAAAVVDEHTIEATSARVTGRLTHRDEIWEQCYADLMVQANRRVIQELTRLGGDYAHVFDERIDARHDDVTGEAWLHGRFTYVLYRKTGTGDAAAQAGEESS